MRAPPPAPVGWPVREVAQLLTCWTSVTGRPSGSRICRDAGVRGNQHATDHPRIHLPALPVRGGARLPHKYPEQHMPRRRSQSSRGWYCDPTWRCRRTLESEANLMAKVSTTRRSCRSTGRGSRRGQPLHRQWSTAPALPGDGRSQREPLGCPQRAWPCGPDRRGPWRPPTAPGSSTATSSRRTSVHPLPPPGAPLRDLGQQAGPAGQSCGA